MNVDVESKDVNEVEVIPVGDKRTWALLGHLSALSAFITGFGCVLGPLIVWLVKRDTLPFAGDQAKEALNFNLSMFIYAALLTVLVIFTLGIGIIVALPMWGILALVWIVCTLIASFKAYDGQSYRYPLTIRLFN